MKRQRFLMHSLLGLLAISICLVGLPTMGQVDYTLQDDDVTVDENGYITACSYDFWANSGAGGTNLTIPEILDGKEIKGIGDDNFNIFRNKAITSVQFPSTIEYIGISAFGVNWLGGNITIPASVTTIGDFAFDSNGLLTSAIILNSATSFGDYVFEYASENFKLIGYEGSTAETYANENGHPFLVIGNYYTISFNKNAADATGNMEAMEYVAGETALTANAFERIGYTFDGWATSATGSKEYEDEATINVSADMELYAVWVAETYNISFHKNAEDATGTMDPMEGVSGSTVLTTNAFERLGYTFDGWATSESGSKEYEDGATVDVTADMELYAVWVAETYSITFNKNAEDATGTMDPMEGVSGSTVLTTNAFERLGYTFDGWATSESGSKEYEDGATVDVSADMELYAVWVAETYTITFHKNAEDATGTMDPMEGISGSTVLTTNAFERLGYTFDGWATSATGSKEYEDGATVDVSADMELYAVWMEEVYTVTFSVYNNSSQAIEGADIDINGTILTTDSNGETDIELPNGEHSYNVSHPDFMEESGTLQVEGANITIEVNLEPSGVELVELLDIKAYPNPFVNELVLEGRFSASGKAVIYDMAGHVVKTIDLLQEITRINTSNLSKGFYFIKIMDNKEECVMKLTK